MFKRNDKALLTTRIIFMVIIGILAVLSLVAGILLAVEFDGVYFLFTFVGWFLCWIMWVFTRLYLSYLADIKLIRNKLYGANNDDLDVFLKSKEERKVKEVSVLEMQVKRQMVNTELAHLKQLLNAGVITAEEYEKRKEELTNE